MNSTKPIRIPELTGWRGVFILMIFFHHVDLFPAGGTTGVAFFFLLGGFAMTLGYSEKVLESSFQYGTYLSKRASKFYPIHWITLFAFCILNYLCSVPVSVKTFVPNFFLLQSFVPDRAVYYAYNSPAWYLCDTLFFAALFPFIIKTLNKLKDSWILKVLVVVLVAAYVIVEVITPEKWRHAILYISPFVRLFDYIIGILAGLWFITYLEGEKRGKSLMLYAELFLSLLLLVGVILLPSEFRMFSSVYWIPLTGLILCTALLSQGGGGKFLRSKVLVSFGEVSFAFYMLHSLCIDVVKVFFSKMGCDNQILYVCSALALTIVLSYLATRYFINPVAKWFNQKITK